LPSRLIFVFVCLLLSAPAWAAGSPVVYVSGAGGTILSVDTSTGVASPLITNSSAAYEGLVVGPNNDPGTSAANPYLLYACDPTHNTIIRFDPNKVAAGTHTVYQGTAALGTLQQPQCGRIDSAGDLIVNSKTPGSGAWKIAGVASLPLSTPTASFSAPVQLGTTSAAQAGQGVTQKYSGDLLAVDSVGKQVVRYTIQLPASDTTGYSFVPASPPGFITTNLSNPIGIARNNSGQVYVSDHTSNNKGDVQLFDSTGTFVSTCVSTLTFGNEQPNFLGIAEDGTLYVTASTSSKGFVWSVTQSAGTCTPTQLVTATSLPTLTGIALPPTQTSIGPLSQAGVGTLSYNFGSSLLNVTGSCSNLTITKTLLPTPALTALANINGQVTIDNSLVTLSGGAAVPYLGDGGFASRYSAPDSPAACQNSPVPDILIAALVDQILFRNTWIIRCDPAFGGTSCNPIDLDGIYFLGGFIPQDSTVHGTGCCSDFFLANMNLNSGAQATLNLGSPLTQVALPNLAGTFSSGSTISVKFKFTPTIKNAVAILAVAQVCQPGTPSTNDPICGPNGQSTVFPINIINIGSSGSSTVPPPIITFSPANQQYQFSLSLKGYAPGIYSLSVITLSNNTKPVTVIVKII
jgi:sugar lactone lactonase YvrE